MPLLDAGRGQKIMCHALAQCQTFVSGTVGLVLHPPPKCEGKMNDGRINSAWMNNLNQLTSPLPEDAAIILKQFLTAFGRL